MTLTQRRVVVLRQIREHGAVVQWWLVARNRRILSSGYRPFFECRAIGIRGPGFVCVAGQRLVHARHVLRGLEARIAAAAEAKQRASLVHAHYDGWLCIHAREGAWNANTGNGYLGGLQMTPGWGGLARPDLASPATQIATAEYQASLNHWSYTWMQGQWPNTFPPCAGFFE